MNKTLDRCANQPGERIINSRNAPKGVQEQDDNVLDATGALDDRGNPDRWLTFSDRRFRHETSLAEVDARLRFQ